MQKNIDIPYDQIADFCRKYHIRKLLWFGSVLRDDFRPDSDVDVLVEFEPSIDFTLQTMIDMENELKRILQHDIDLGDIQSVKTDANYIRRKHIFNSAPVIYER